MVAFDFAGIRIEGEYRRGIEIVPRMHIGCPGRGIPRSPIDQVELRVVIACAPGRHPARLPGLPRPGVVARLPRSWDGIRLPGFLACLRIIGGNEAANTQFTPRGAHHDLALGYQWRKS